MITTTNTNIQLQLHTVIVSLVIAFVVQQKSHNYILRVAESSERSESVCTIDSY
jgi:uncharacterized protein HemY